MSFVEYLEFEEAANPETHVQYVDVTRAETTG